MNSRYGVLSGLNGRLFMCDVGTAGTEGAKYTDITVGLRKAPGIKIITKTKKYDVACNGGWAVIAITGREISSLSLSYVREIGSDVYETITEWTKETLKAFEPLSVSKDLVFMIPNENGTYNTTVIHVVNKEEELPGIDPAEGQSFSIALEAGGGVEFYNGTIVDNTPTLTPVE